MAVTVPGQRRDSLAAQRAERVQRVGEALRARCNFAIGRPMEPTVGVARNDLAPAVPCRDVVDKVRDQKRTLLHQPEHNSLPWPLLRLHGFSLQNPKAVAYSYITRGDAVGNGFAVRGGPCWTSATFG